MTIRECVNRPGATDHDTAHCPMKPQAIAAQSAPDDLAAAVRVLLEVPQLQGDQAYSAQPIIDLVRTQLAAWQRAQSAPDAHERWLSDPNNEPFPGGLSGIPVPALQSAPDEREAVRGPWFDGEPPHPWNKEWFIAETIYGDRVVLCALHEDHTYDYRTADGTYMLAKNIKRWCQFPDSEYVKLRNQPIELPAYSDERGSDGELTYEAKAHNKCLDEVARLNPVAKPQAGASRQRAQSAPVVPEGWSKSLGSCWPSDEDYPQGDWSIGTVDEDGNRYEVVRVEASQYDAEGESQKIAEAIVRLWGSAAPQPAARQEQGDEVRRLREALEWYDEKVQDCRKLGATGDNARQALDLDGGFRARDALAASAEGK